MDELALRRFNRASAPRELAPADVLGAALLDPEVQEATHIMVIYGKANDDGSVTSGWLQGGGFDPFGQAGLLARIQHRLWERN